MAIDDIITKLYMDFGGVTHTCTDPTVLTGYYCKWDKTSGVVTGSVTQDQIIWILVDVDQRLDDPRLEYFSKLKSDLQKDLDEDVMWIVCHKAWRFI